MQMVPGTVPGMKWAHILNFCQPEHLLPSRVTMGLIWESWKLWSPVPQGLFTPSALMQTCPVGTTAYWGQTWKAWGTEPPKGLREGGLTSSCVTSH